MSKTEHVVHFYETDLYLLDSLTDFIGSGLAAGEGCIVIATQSHRASLEERLIASDLDLAAAISRDDYISLDAAETLSSFMVDGWPEPQRFTQIISDMITRATKGRSHVRIFGELVALLCAEGKRAAAIRLEELWNELGTVHSFSLFCGYPMHSFNGAIYEGEFAAICNQHAQVIPAESYSALDGADERLRTITLLQQKANSLEIELARRKELEQRKDEFISMASHELRTPLTVLKGFTQLLQRRVKRLDDGESIRFLDRMSTQLDKLTRLVGDLLDISKMQKGQLDYRMQPFDLLALAQEVVENVQATTQTHHLILQKAAEACILGDRERIGQVLINLLANAIKYSPDADQVIVQVETEGTDVLVSVQDFGIGIDEAYHEKIFERFYQVNAPVEKTYPGLGIGLYIAAEIIKRHSGHLRLKSCKGKGSTFTFCLPLLVEVGRVAGEAQIEEEKLSI